MNPATLPLALRIYHFRPELVAEFQRKNEPLRDRSARSQGNLRPQRDPDAKHGKQAAIG